MMPESNRENARADAPAQPGYRFRAAPRLVLDLAPMERTGPPQPASRARRAWGGVVLGIGGLWLAGGTAGLLTGQHVPWIMPLLGLVLVRVGWNLRRGPRP